MNKRFSAFIVFICLLTCAASASAHTFTHPLSVGSEGSDVSALQQFLKDHGYFTYPTITGYFGSATWSAVAAFQKANNLEPVGNVGPQTRALLNTAPTNTSTNPTLSQTQTQSILDLLRSFGADEAVIQQMRTALGVSTALWWYPPPIPGGYTPGFGAGAPSSNTDADDADDDSDPAVTFNVDDQTLFFGALTLASAGGVAPTTTVGTISTSTIISGNSAGHWQISSNGTITPTSAGDSANLSGGPYTLTVLFGDGTTVDSAEVAITVEANVYSVTTGELAAVIALGSATIDGKTIKGRPGADIGGANVGDTVTFASGQTYSTGLTITSYSSTNPTMMRRVIARYSGTVTLKDMILRDYYRAGVDTQDTRLWNFAAAGPSILVLDGGEYYSDSMSDIDPSAADADDVGSLRLFGSDGFSIFANLPSMVVRNGAYFHDARKAIAGTFQTFTMDDSVVDNMFEDHLSLGFNVGTGTIAIRDNQFKRIYGDPDDPSNPHGDRIQITSSSTPSFGAGTATITGNIFYNAGSRSDGGQDIFITPNQFSTPYDKGVIVKIEHNIIHGRSAHGITVYDAEDTSYVRANTVAADIGHYSLLPKINIIDTYGDVEVAYNAAPDVALTNSGLANVHNNYEWGTTSGDNESSDYAAFLAGPSFDSNAYSSVSDQISALTPKPSGTLDSALPGVKIGAGWYYDYETGISDSPWDEDGFNANINWRNVVDVEPGTATTSSKIQVTGIGANGAVVYVTGGTSPSFDIYDTDGVTPLFSNQTGYKIIYNNQYVQIEDIVSSEDSTLLSVLIHMGSTTGTWSHTSGTGGSGLTYEPTTLWRSGSGVNYKELTQAAHGINTLKKFTLAGRFRRPNLTTQANPFRRSGGSSAINSNISGSFEALFTNGASTILRWTTTSGTITANTWYSWAISADTINGVYKLYINGVDQGAPSVTPTANADFNFNASLAFGGSPFVQADIDYQGFPAILWSDALDLSSVWGDIFDPDNSNQMKDLGSTGTVGSVAATVYQKQANTTKLGTAANDGSAADFTTTTLNNVSNE